MNLAGMDCIPKEALPPLAYLSTAQLVSMGPILLHTKPMIVLHASMGNIQREVKFCLA